jgi:hypothetical protein
MPRKETLKQQLERTHTRDELHLLLDFPIGWVDLDLGYPKRGNTHLILVPRTWRDKIELNDWIVTFPQGMRFNFKEHEEAARAFVEQQPNIVHFKELITVVKIS